MTVTLMPVPPIVTMTTTHQPIVCCYRQPNVFNIATLYNGDDSAVLVMYCRAFPAHLVMLQLFIRSSPLLHLPTYHRATTCDRLLPPALPAIYLPPLPTTEDIFYRLPSGLCHTPVW